MDLVTEIRLGCEPGHLLYLSYHRPPEDLGDPQLTRIAVSQAPIPPPRPSSPDLKPKY